MTKSKGIQAKHRSMGKIAEDVLSRALLAKPELFNSTGLQAEYDLDDYQVFKVKKYTKRLAADKGALFAWDPALGKFRVCPSNSRTVAKSMLDYAYKSWRENGSEINTLIRGAHNQGHVSKRVLDSTKVRNDSVKESISSAQSKIRYSA